MKKMGLYTNMSLAKINLLKERYGQSPAIKQEAAGHLLDQVGIVNPEAGAAITITDDGHISLRNKNSSILIHGDTGAIILANAATILDSLNVFNSFSIGYSPLDPAFMSPYPGMLPMTKVLTTLGTPLTDAPIIPLQTDPGGASPPHFHTLSRISTKSLFKRNQSYKRLGIITQLKEILGM